MTLAHIAGVPLEEWIVPLVASGTGIVVGLRAAAQRCVGRLPRPESTGRVP